MAATTFAVAAALALAPQDGLRKWQSSRLKSFSQAFDASRYHAQVLIVDDDGFRARTCEALLERVALWSDAGWWIYPHSASVGSVRDGSRVSLPSLRRSFERLDLCLSRLEAATSRLGEEDLDSHDLILCVDLDVLETVRKMARASGSNVDAVLCISDFLAYGGDRMANLDEGLQDVVAPHYASAVGGAQLPGASPSGGEWGTFIASAALASAGLVGYLKDGIDDFFEKASAREAGGEGSVRVAPTARGSPRPTVPSSSLLGRASRSSSLSTTARRATGAWSRCGRRLSPCCGGTR